MAGSTIATAGNDLDTVRQTLNGALGDANMADKGITFGKVGHLLPVGKMDACYSVVSLSAAKGNYYDVPHNLGHEPGFVILVHAENTQTPVSHYSAIGWERDKWTHSNVRVRVHVVVGSLDGGQATFIVAGRR